jgi:lipopolysaccharide export system protein LptC
MVELVPVAGPLIEQDTPDAAMPVPGLAVERWPPRAPGDAYSRRVAFLKRFLPAIGVGLLLLVAAWPRIRPLLDSVRLTLPVIERRDARELRMVDPRYAGIDRLNRPYVLTAVTARQMPGQNDLMSLDHPRGRLILRGGATVVLTAATGVYQTEVKLLDLFGHVTLTHQNGTRFVTQAAHIDIAAQTASGHDPVSGKGPSGDIEAEGFRILDRGDTVFFTGGSHLLLKRVAVGRAGPPPPALPVPVENAAGRLAAAALELRAEETVARSPAGQTATAGRPTANLRSTETPEPKGPAATVSGGTRRAE